MIGFFGEAALRAGCLRFPGASCSSESAAREACARGLTGDLAGWPPRSLARLAVNVDSSSPSSSRTVLAGADRVDWNVSGVFLVAKGPLEGIDKSKAQHTRVSDTPALRDLVSLLWLGLVLVLHAFVMTPLGTGWG